MSVERNDPCPCGSGKKYKNCCQSKRSTSPWIAVGIGVLVVGLAVVAVVLNRSDAHEQPTAQFVPPVPGQTPGHDHAPAKAVGLARCWIDRRGGEDGSGATKALDDIPDVHFHFDSMAALVQAHRAALGS